MITQQEFQHRIDERFPNESFTVIEYNNSLGKEAVIKCNNCGRELAVSKASNFLIYSKRVGCKYCQNSFYKQRNELIEQIKDSSKPLIITTIQKMANACTNPKYAHIMEKYKDLKTVFIIDECHRSQFGDMHKQIAKTFTNAHSKLI